jgi:hypothetical protein
MTPIMIDRNDMAFLAGAVAAALLSFQAWGLPAAVAAALVAGLVGLRRTMPLPVAVAAAAAAGSAMVHFAVAPEHFEEWWGFGLFFVLCAEVQLGWALLVARRHGRRMLAVGIVGSLFLVGTWVLSRAAGLPFGPEPGVAEAVGTPDVVSVVLELVTVGACAWALALPRQIRSRSSAPIRATALTGAVVLTAWGLAAIGTA